MDSPEPREMLELIAAQPPTSRLLEVLGPDFEPPVLLVGGAVRDLLSCRTPVDLDVVVEGPLTTLAERLGAPMTASEHLAYDRFGTATIVLDGVRIDAARARRETYAAPGALPDVEPAGAVEDLQRRDFTVNAIGVRLTGPERGATIAVEHALDDLSAGRLRVLHTNSFVDDPTRLFRLARYGARLRFRVEPETFALAHAAVAGGALATVSGTRIGNEIRLLAGEPDPVAAFSALAELEVDHAIDPGFGLTDDLLARRALSLLPAGERRDRLVIAAAMLALGPGALLRLTDLDFSASDKGVIFAAAARAQALAARLEMAGQPSEIDAAIGNAPAEQVALAGALGPAGAAREWLVRLRHARLQIDGDDLVEAGIAPGPAIGEGLAAARAALLDGEAPGREQQLQVALRAARDWLA